MVQSFTGATRTDYLYGMGRLSTRTSGSTNTWYVADALGSVRMTLDDAAAPLGTVTYDPWGTPESGTVPTFGFTGELQQGGDVYLRARWYHAGSGRFASVDPFAGAAETPYSLHPYQYAYADPVRLRDPRGRCIPENIAVLGEEGCQFLGWNPMKWNWADGRAYYYGTPGTIGKMALMALFPPAAFVYGPENAALSYIRYNENPTECNGVLVVVDTVLAVLPFASLAKITGGAGPMLGGGAVALNAAQTQLLKLEVAAVAVGAGYIPNVFYARQQGSSDPSGRRGGGGNPPKLPDNPDLKYVREKHAKSGKYLEDDKSYFYDYLTDEDYMNMFDTAANTQPYPQRNGNWAWVVTDHWENVGIDRSTGQNTHIFTIILDQAGDLVSMYPGYP